MVKLKPCPFCGTAVEMKIIFNSDLTVTLAEKDREVYDALIEKWNRRTE
ncbi:MAG: Lar family restriction alleviation protein [Ruminococcus sp.]|nr:Lar family restriction alleviation protein [Ruminococcus sp.]